MQKLRCTLPAAILATMIAAPAIADTSVFDFTSNLNATVGTATLGYFNGATTSGSVTFGKASALGIAALPGGDADVISLSAFSQNQALALDTNAGPNGGSSTYINQYTLGFDLLLPDNNRWFSFYNTNANNTNDGDFFVQPASGGGGIGINGLYNGTVNANTWYRIMVTVDSTAGVNQMRKYINGSLVGSQPLDGFDGRWSLYSEADNIPTYLFADNDGDTARSYVNSVLFSDRVFSDAEIAALGGPKATGFAAVPGPAPLFVLAGGAAPLIGLRCRRRMA